MLSKGGAKMIALSEPILGDEEKRVLCEVIDSGWITMGERVAAFENAFARLQGVEQAVAVNSCTAALHLALEALKIGPGDEVLVPSLSFVATANAVLYAGATPVFADINSLSSPHTSLQDAQAKCSSKTKAVIVMHFGGYVADLAEWRFFADRNMLYLIEDAAHAPGVDGVGSLSDAAAFSFFGNKNMSTAEGGMITARDSSVIERMRRLRAHGMTTDTLTRHRGHAYSYDVSMVGYNYRMDELRAAVGMVQLARLRDWNEIRRKFSRKYRNIISRKAPEIIIPFSEEHPTAAHLMAVVLPEGINRFRVMDYMRDQGIQTSIHYPPIHKFSYHRAKFPGVFLPHTESFADRELTLPLHPSLAEDDIDKIVSALRVGMRQS
jgi:dTDP-4-amino-4,6-dideoxygalactose transaminase